jgi:hypothetical protein
LDRAVAEGTLPKPKVWDPLLEILSERGAAHEQNYIEHLTKSGLEVVRIDGGDITNDSVGATLSAIRGGVQVIAQAAPSEQGWNGYAGGKLARASRRLLIAKAGTPQSTQVMSERSSSQTSS